MKKVLCINTGGAGNLHGRRMRRLTAGLEPAVTYYDLDRSLSRWESAWQVRALLKSAFWNLVYLEGTGIAAGTPLMVAARRHGQRYIVSSGDPIAGFFRNTRGRMAGWTFALYERLLYRLSAAFVGWTPYLTGAALHLGARRAITIEGAVDLELFHPLPPAQRAAVRARFGFGVQDLVCGVVGSLVWTPRQAYCYGLELIETLKRVKRRDLAVLIVGDGDGRSRLEAALPEALRGRVAFAGRLPEEEVVEAINAMDIGFVTQTLDGLGSFRLTTKLPEYLACGVPVAMSPIPGFYDYAAQAGWPLPAFHPASSQFHQQCARWLDQLEPAEIAEKSRRSVAVARQHFDYRNAAAKFATLVEELLNDS